MSPFCDNYKETAPSTILFALQKIINQGLFLKLEEKKYSNRKLLMSRESISFIFFQSRNTLLLSPLKYFILLLNEFSVVSTNYP